MNNTNRNSKNLLFGLSRGEAEEALKVFLSTENDIKVFSLKGDWGVGKTHLLKSFLNKEKQNYYYASAFGLSSIEEIKLQLLSNFYVNSQAQKSQLWKLNLGNRVRFINDNSQHLGSLVEAVPKIGGLGSGFTPAAIALTSNFIINNSLKGKLICIDDLERRSKNLSLSDLLGFVERLVEEKGCRVILIYNENKIQEDEEAKNTLKEYREKVIDYEIKLDPSKIENFRIGFGSNDADEDVILKYLKNNYIQTNNIRIFRKLKWSLDRVRENIGNPLPEVKKQIVNEIIFILLSRFDSDFPVNLENLILLGDFSSVLASKEEGNEKLYILAHSLGYTGSEISSEINCLIETSICDFQKLRNEIDKLDNREKSHKIREKLHKAYEPYADSFEDSEVELYRNLTNFLDENASFLDIREFQSLENISLIIDLDLKPYKEVWVRHKINSLKTLDEFYQLRSILQENHGLAGDNLMSEVEEKIRILENDMSIDTVLAKILTNKSWSKEDSSYLNERTLEQCVQWLLKKNPDKHFLVRQGLRMEEYFSQTLEEAISKLAQKSKLNAARAKNLYGIDVENDAS